MLANSNMDAAKVGMLSASSWYHLSHVVPFSSSTVQLNRCLQVSQGAASETDLLALAEGCLLATGSRPPTDADLVSAPPPSRKRLRGLCHAFQELQVDPACWAPHPPRTNGSAGLFHQRDFVYLLRNLRRQMDRAAALGAPFDEAIPFSADMLLSALRRNFGGVSDAAFAALAGRFLRDCDLEGEAPTLQTVATLRESLADAVEPGDDPNTAAFRHILLLDPTDVEVSIAVLFELGLMERVSTTVVALSDFTADSSDLLRSQAVASIKSAAELGHTVLLTNPGVIASSIFGECVHEARVYW